MVWSRKSSEDGFTLVELLIVIVILGILAAVVVFAVSGITDRGQSNACTADVANLRAAQEAYYSTDSTYGNEAELKDEKRIGSFSTLHDVTVGANQSAAEASANTNSQTSAATGAAYAIKRQSAECGTVGSVVQ